MKNLESLNNDVFKKLNPVEMGKITGGGVRPDDEDGEGGVGLAPYNTYATSGAGGATPPANQPSDTNDLGTQTKTVSDWKNL